MTGFKLPMGNSLERYYDESYYRDAWEDKIWTVTFQVVDSLEQLADIATDSDVKSGAALGDRPIGICRY